LKPTTNYLPLTIGLMNILKVYTAMRSYTCISEDILSSLPLLSERTETTTIY